AVLGSDLLQFVPDSLPGQPHCDAPGIRTDGRRRAAGVLVDGPGRGGEFGSGPPAAPIRRSAERSVCGAVQDAARSSVGMERRLRAPLKRIQSNWSRFAILVSPLPSWERGRG